MSNIHGFNDQRAHGSGEMLNRSAASRPQQRNSSGSAPSRDQSGTDPFADMQDWNYTAQNLQEVQKHRVMFLSGTTNIKNPKDENYFDMLKIACCPVVKIISITLLLLLAQLAMFITSIAMGINEDGELLQIKANVLYELGANHSPSIANGQVYRLISAQFLHVNFIHYFGNALTTLIFVSRFQYTVGWWKTLIIFLLSGIGGNIFSVLTQPSDDVIKAGSSTCLYGIIGGIIGYVILNWKGFEIIGKLLKCQLVFISILIVVFIFVLTPNGKNIDYLGHLGGFITGLTLISIHETIRNRKREKVMRIVFLTLCVIFFLICFLVFYLAKK